MKVRIANIDWDIDEDDDIELPTEFCIYVPRNVKDVEDYISDYLSNTYGYCHNGFNYEKI